MHAKATFHESGFNYDDYPMELAWTLRMASAGGIGGTGASGGQGKMCGSDERANRYVVL